MKCSHTQQKQIHFTRFVNFIQDSHPYALLSLFSHLYLQNVPALVSPLLADDRSITEEKRKNANLHSAGKAEVMYFAFK